MTENKVQIKGRVNKAVGGYYNLLAKDLAQFADTILTVEVVAVEPAPPRPPKVPKEPKKVTGEAPVGK